MSQRVPAATRNAQELFAERENGPLGRLVKTTLDTKNVEHFCECGREENVIPSPLSFFPYSYCFLP